MSYFELLQQVAPETIMVIAALGVLGIDLFVMRDEPLRHRWWVGAAFAAFGCLAAASWMLVVGGKGGPDAMFANDTLTQLVKTGVLVLTICTLVLSAEGTDTEHVGEYLALILLATVGMMFLVSATDLLMVFLALELTSLCLYILAAFNKRNVASAEASLKYFLFGGMSAAFTLFGLSLVYGLSGSTGLSQIAAKLATGAPGHDPLLLASLVLTAIGFGFKVAAAPFHLWAPDTYQGAPTPSAALIASGSKVASFFVFARVMHMALGAAGGSSAWHAYAAGWLPVVAILATLSIFWGNLAAIAQSNVKRLLAYSAVAHAGYALLGLLGGGDAGLSSLVFYTFTYGLTVVGAFGVVAVVEARTGNSRLTDFAGLSRREPLVAFCMMVFMLSLAGIPPLAGFFGKFYLFTAVAKDLGMMWLVVFAVGMSAVSLYYYLQVLKQIYIAPVPAGADAGTRRAAVSSRVMLGLLALAVVALGCAPNLIVGRLLAAIQQFGF